MMPQARTPDGASTDSSEITPTELFTVFAHERRQLALAYLSHRGTAISIGDLAEYIAVTEGDPTYEWYERIVTDLHHSHLPQMCDLGIVDYDVESERISLTVDTGIVTPYLDLAGHIV